jgi:hypothetical protein
MVNNAMVKPFFAVNRSCMYKGLQMSPTGKNPED